MCFLGLLRTRERVCSGSSIVLVRWALSWHASPASAVVSGETGVGAERTAPGRKRRREGGPEPPEDRLPAKVHRVVDDTFTHNRRGVRLCQDFRTGDCEGDNHGGRCRRDPSCVHQCSICLLLGHGRSQHERKGSGKGKKGKGGGKAGRY